MLTDEQVRAKLKDELFALHKNNYCTAMYDSVVARVLEDIFGISRDSKLISSQDDEFKCCMYPKSDVETAIRYVINSPESIYHPNYVPPTDIPSIPSSDPSICIICMDKPRNAAFVHGETAHVFGCMECCAQLSRCPMCRKHKKNVIRLFD